MVDVCYHFTFYYEEIAWLIYTTFNSCAHNNTSSHNDKEYQMHIICNVSSHSLFPVMADCPHTIGVEFGTRQALSLFYKVAILLALNSLYLHSTKQRICSEFLIETVGTFQNYRSSWSEDQIANMGYSRAGKIQSCD